MSSTMQAVVKEKPATDADWPAGLRIEQRPAPQIRNAGDVLIRVVAAGICGTDVGIYNSKKSLRDEMRRMQSDSVIIGHEFCGRLVDAGPEARQRLAEIVRVRSRYDAGAESFVAGRSPADISRDENLLGFLGEHFYVSAEMHKTCGWCRQCKLNQRHACQNTIIQGVHEDGAFAEYLIVPSANLVYFRKDELPVPVIAFMDAIGNAVHTIQSVNVSGQAVAILGCGVQGLMATAVARHSGASRIYVTDFAQDSRGLTHEKLEHHRFALARRFGADDCFDLALPGEPDRMRRIVFGETNGAGVDAVFEMSGSYGAYREAFELVRMGGTVSLLGIPEGSTEVNFAHDVIFRGLTIHGIIGRRIFETWEAMRAILRAGLAKEILESGFITREIPLAHVAEGMKTLIKGDALKVILRP